MNIPIWQDGAFILEKWTQNLRRQARNKRKAARRATSARSKNEGGR